MEARSSADQDQDQERVPQTRYVYGHSFMARNFGRVMDHLRSFETSVNTSTFGRVFRLDGSGHVGSSLNRLLKNVTENM